MSRSRLNTRFFIALLSVVVVLPAGYIGAYYSLVQRGLPYSWRVIYFPPEYRLGGEVAEKFFSPAHRIDRWLRPDYWGS